MLVCWGVGYLDGDASSSQFGFFYSAGAAILLGIVLWATTRGAVDLTRRDGIGVVTFGWLLSTLLGALPFLMTKTIPDFPGAWFESASGFTTTGASVMTNLEEMPRGILLWRAVTNFLGGMGILVLCVAILPLLGSGGMQIYRAEATGPSKDRLTPRIAGTAKLLWGIYVGLNVLNILALKACGMGWFDSVCHAFAAIATGGFSTRTASVAAFHSPAIEWVLILFMLLGGANFALHWRFLRGDWSAHLRNSEFRVYLLIIFAAFVAIALNLGPAAFHEPNTGPRGILFSIVSIITTTGFGTDDFARWPALSQYVLLLLMVVGGSAGSTSGGLKVVRVLVLFKQAARELKLFIQPQAVYHVKIGRQLVEPDVVSMIGAFCMIYAMVFTIAAASMMIFVPDMKTAVSSVAAALGNVGPGLGSVGPQANYGGVHAGGKLILTLCMLMGRLEFYTMLVMLMPRFWRR